MPEGVDSSNLIHIKMDARENIRDLKLNVQSIKNKELELYGQLVHHNIDLYILTETWLSENALDTTWLQCMILNKDRYQMLTSNRTGRKGGV